MRLREQLGRRQFTSDFTFLASKEFDDTFTMRLYAAEARDVSNCSVRPGASMDWRFHDYYTYTPEYWIMEAETTIVPSFVSIHGDSWLKDISMILAVVIRVNKVQRKQYNIIMLNLRRWNSLLRFSERRNLKSKWKLLFFNYYHAKIKKNPIVPARIIPIPNNSQQNDASFIAFLSRQTRPNPLSPVAHRTPWST